MLSTFMALTLLSLPIALRAFTRSLVRARDKVELTLVTEPSEIVTFVTEIVALSAFILSLVEKAVPT